jgi:hypothetical protein
MSSFVFTLCMLALYSTGLSHASDNGPSYLWSMVHSRSSKELVLDIHRPSTGRGKPPCGPLRGNAPPSPPPHLPVSLEQLLATQNELTTLLIQNETCHEAEQPQHPRHQDMNTPYSEFLSTHLPLFSRAKDLIEADDWLRTTESMFSLLHCTEYQKTLYGAQ